MLLDNLMDALPTIGELTSWVPEPLERPLVREAWHLVREAWHFLTSLGIVGFMHHYWGLAVAGCVGMFLVLYGVQLATAFKSQDVSIAKIRVLGTEVVLRRAAGVGCMIGGIAVLLLALQLHQLNSPGF